MMPAQMLILTRRMSKCFQIEIFQVRHYSIQEKIIIIVEIEQPVEQNFFIVLCLEIIVLNGV